MLSFFRESQTDGRACVFTGEESPNSIGPGCWVTPRQGDLIADAPQKTNRWFLTASKGETAV